MHAGFQSCLAILSFSYRRHNWREWRIDEGDACLNALADVQQSTVGPSMTCAPHQGNEDKF